MGRRRRFYLQIIQRVHLGAVDAHFKVAVRAGGVAGGAALGHHLTGADLIAHAHQNLAVMGIQGGQAVPVVNDQIPTVAVIQVLNQNHRAAGRCIHIGAGGYREVNTPVVTTAGVVGIPGRNVIIHLSAKIKDCLAVVCPKCYNRIKRL